MIYKFNSTNSNGIIEVSKDDLDASILISNDEYEIRVNFSKETLYDLIGALHSIQTKLKNNKGGKNG